ncbi:hypothetical protein PsYK624_075350 [Phanerochaete sordida]|uniref:Uncharacterized protein n=1 Tax=Phanerochaete sordida TaxID=48140 RepID=A0A9P3GB49_9APHY|nr:hypothetical protein PsYK624_075350 [Phanerochaete sordida]
MSKPRCALWLSDGEALGIQHRAGSPNTSFELCKLGEILMVRTLGRGWREAGRTHYHIWNNTEYKSLTGCFEFALLISKDL